MTIKILSRYSKKALFCCEAETLRSCLEAGVKERADLRGANLYEANLYEANLRGANLRGANLYEADLRGADLRGANLYEANLRWADLRGANLYEANLRGADLRWAIGNGLEIKSMHIGRYSIVFSKNPSRLHIGCETHTLEEWLGFSDEDISKMDDGALSFMKKYKPLIKSFVESD